MPVPLAQQTAAAREGLSAEPLANSVGSRVEFGQPAAVFVGKERLLNRTMRTPLVAERHAEGYYCREGDRGPSNPGGRRLLARHDTRFPPAMPYVLFLSICVVWGSSFILMKKAVVCFSPFGVGLFRVAGGAAILGLLWCRRSRRWPFRRTDWLPLALVVVCGFAWPFSVQPYLVARQGSAFVGMSVGFTPLLTILASVPILGIYPAPRQLLGVCGALGCMGLLMFDGWERAIPVVDLVCAFSVPLGYALTNTTIRRSLRHLPPLELTLLSQFVAAGLLLPFALTVPGPPAASEEAVHKALLSLGFLGVIGTGLASLWFNQLVREQGPLFAGMVTNLIPLGALAWGWADDEPVTPRQLAALVGLMAMVTVVQYGAVQPPKPPEGGAAVPDE